MHRYTSSACLVLYLFRLVPPKFYFPFAKAFDDLQLSAYSRFNHVDITSHSQASRQLTLRLRDGGHGFTSLQRLAHASYAASIIESSTLRIQDPEHPSYEFYRRNARRAMHYEATRPNPNLLPDGYIPHFSPLGCIAAEALFAGPERPFRYLYQELHSFSERCF